MKRIFHFVRSNGLSGIENVVINICTMVHGYNYTYVSTDGPIDKYLKHYGIKHIIIPHLDPFNIYKVIKTYNPDIVQAHDAKVSVFMLFSSIYCKRHHIKMISELHNDDPKMSKWWRLRTILYALSSFAYKNIVVVSNDIVKNFAYNRLIKNKVSFIPNVVNPNRIKEGLIKNNYRKKWDCAFLGRIAYQKNPNKFIKIIFYLKKLNPNIKAILIGDGDLLNDIKQLSLKYNVVKNIRFVGFKSNPYKYIQESKILVVTSRYEGLPLSVLESLMIRTPVISTPLKILKQLFGEHGLFAKTDVDFTKKIFKLLNNKSYYNNCLSQENNCLQRINNVNRFIYNYNYLYK